MVHALTQGFLAIPVMLVRMRQYASHRSTRTTGRTPSTGSDLSRDWKWYISHLPLAPMRSLKGRGVYDRSSIQPVSTPSVDLQTAAERYGIPTQEPYRTALTPLALWMHLTAAR